MPPAPENGSPGEDDAGPVASARSPESAPGTVAPPHASRGLRVALGASLGAIIAFTVLVVGVFHGQVPVLDQFLEARVAEWREPHLTQCMFAVTLLADWRPILATVTIAYLACAVRRASSPHLDLVAAVLGMTFLVNTALKGWFQRPRPLVPPPLVDEAFYSFPSGHAITAICLYGILAYLATRRLPGPGQWAVAWCGFVGVTALVGFSRVYLGAHYPSDVLAGYLAGVPVLAAAIVLHRSAITASASRDGRKEDPAR